VIAFAHVGGKTSNQVQVDARPEPVSHSQRGGGFCGTTDDIRLPRAILEDRDHLATYNPFPGCAIPHEDVLYRRADRPMSGHEIGCQAAGAHHEQCSRIGAREQLRAQRRVGGRLAISERRRIDDCAGRTIFSVEGRLERLDGRAFTVFSEDSDRFGAHCHTPPPGG